MDTKLVIIFCLMNLNSRAIAKQNCLHFNIIKEFVILMADPQQ